LSVTRAALFVMLVSGRIEVFGWRGVTQPLFQHHFCRFGDGNAAVTAYATCGT